MNPSAEQGFPSSASQAAMWDERYASSSLVWSAEPNALAESLLRNLTPGRALDVAAGEGRMALWLASKSWQVTALDVSPVGLPSLGCCARALAPGGHLLVLGHDKDNLLRGVGGPRTRICGTTANC